MEFDLVSLAGTLVGSVAGTFCGLWIGVGLWNLWKKNK